MLDEPILPPPPYEPPLEVLLLVPLPLGEEPEPLVPELSPRDTPFELALSSAKDGMPLGPISTRPSVMRRSISISSGVM